MTTAVGRDGFPAYTLHQWAKSDRSEPGRIHLLEHHLADVGACFEALLGQPTIRKRLARTGGREDLDRATVSRLSVLAALHDIGKVNMGFQTQIWRPEDLPGGRVPASFRRVGHTRDTVPVLDENGDTETSGWFFPALGFDEMLAWDDRDGLTACGMFVATLSHHGLPLSLEDTLPANSAVWRNFGGLDPQECVGRIAGLVREWFPDAFGGNGEALPPQPAFQHMFLGLCTLADWIGSDEGWFEYRGVPEDGYMAHARRQARRAVEAIGLDITEQRVLLGGMPTRTGFADLFDVPGGAPNAIQRRAALETPLDEPLVIIESETGSGKTEAALWRFARMYEAGLVDGLYFALPTRSAASQLHARVNRFIARMFPEEQRPEPVLAVPGYLKAGDFTGKHLGHYEVWWEDQSSGGTPGRRWAAEGAKRFLAAQIAVGTVDQAMMGALKVRHAHMRAACLARNLLVVDEVHASDTYMRVIIENLLEAHLGAGGYALLMSATLGSHARRSLLSAGRSRFGAGSSITTAEAEAVPYPAVITPGQEGEAVWEAGGNAREKRVIVEAAGTMADFSETARRALEAARQGAKVLVVRNTVGFAIQTQQALEDAAGSAEHQLLFSCGGVGTLHHGRFAAEDRNLLDAAVEEQVGRNREGGGRVVIGTQTLEQSLDIDADLLITDLCPMDVLLQRIGRLQRHERPEGRPAGFERAVCHVLLPDGDDLSPLLKRGSNRNGLGPGGYVYEDLRILEATRRLVAEHAEKGDPWIIPGMNRMLVERATHPDALQTLVDELGDDWIVHGHDITGVRLAEGLTARDAVIRRDVSFLDREVAFGSNEERIRTRLGDEGVVVTFEQLPVSPFDPGLEIGRISIPHHMSRGLDPQDAVAPTATGGGFEFSVGEARFRYDKLGLRRV